MILDFPTLILRQGKSFLRLVTKESVKFLTRDRLHETLKGPLEWVRGLGPTDERLHYLIFLVGFLFHGGLIVDLFFSNWSFDRSGSSSILLSLTIGPCFVTPPMTPIVGLIKSVLRRKLPLVSGYPLYSLRQ